MTNKRLAQLNKIEKTILRSIELCGMSKVAGTEEVINGLNKTLATVKALQQINS